ncbi:MAG TPA: thioredoxin family protein, partial [Verrucomicrobiae bacterium]|nr:thioredoxin family protein [Verrucomicrobiae bacterium]
TADQPSPPGSALSPAAKDPAAANTASNPSNSDSKPATADASNLTGRGVAEVEAALGKPQGKLQTAQGALWLYSQWKVQFDRKGLVLSVKEDRPVRLINVDPAFIAAADAADKAAAKRAAADAAEKARAAAPQVEDIRVVSNGGQEVDLPSLLIEDKITIVDFYADWCGPCQKLSPVLEQLAKDDPAVVLLKVDIVKWETPVARQFDLHSIPSVRVFNRSRTQVGDPTHDVDVVMERVKQAKGS